MRIRTSLVAAAALAALGTVAAPAASAAAGHPTAVSKVPPKCQRGMLHKHGNRDCGKHKGTMPAGPATPAPTAPPAR